MDKKTKTFIAIGVLAAAGYLIWKSQSKPKSFANLVMAGDVDCGVKNGIDKCCKSGAKDANGLYKCCNGLWASSSKDESGCAKAPAGISQL